jgi:hypothetical protein
MRRLAPIRIRAGADAELVGPLSLCELATRRIRSLLSTPPDGRAESLDLSSYNLNPVCEKYIKKSYICPHCRNFIKAPRGYLPSFDYDDVANSHSDEILKSDYLHHDSLFAQWFGPPLPTEEGGEYLTVQGRLCRRCVESFRCPLLLQRGRRGNYRERRVQHRPLLT